MAEYFKRKDRRWAELLCDPCPLPPQAATHKGVTPRLVQCNRIGLVARDIGQFGVWVGSYGLVHIKDG